MGYTHYWHFNVTKKKAAEVEKTFQKAVKAIQKAARIYQNAAIGDDRLSGYTANTKIGSYGGIKINGKGDNMHEDFTLREHFNQNLGSGDFCKTANKPYDTAVVAALILLKHYLGSSFSCSSDGDIKDWYTGLELARKVCPSAKIPSSIRGGYLTLTKAV